MPYWRESTAGDHVVTDESQLNEVEAETPAMFTLIIESFSQVLGADEIFAYENFAEFG
jgi:hypothetical protein